MKTYKVVFSCQSAINDLPSSQAIFGAICTILLQTKGEAEFNRYINSFKENNPLLIHSSMYQDNMYPMIKKNIFTTDIVNQIIADTSPIDKINIFETLKKYKKIKYMSSSIYERYIGKNQLDNLRTDLVKNKDAFTIENGILRDKKDNEISNPRMVLLTRNGFPESQNDKTLFYVNAQYYPKGTNFCVYLKANISKEEIESIFKYFDYFGIGNRRTVGLNSFKFDKLEEIEFLNPTDYRLILSKFIPDVNDFDYSSSFYQLNGDIYRSSKEYTGGFINGKYVHFLEGSWMKVNQKKEYYGRIIETMTEGKCIYHYGIGFSV